MNEETNTKLVQQAYQNIKTGDIGSFLKVLAEKVLWIVPDMSKREKVVVLGHFTMRAKATGKLSRSSWAHVWKVEGHQVSYMREYVDTLAVSRAHSRTDHVEAAT